MKKDVLIYTFKTYKHINILTTYYSNIFIFNKLSKDFQIFKTIVDENQPRIIVGIAQKTYPYNYSRFERTAINKFTKNKSINQNGISSYKLHYPKNGYKSIKLSKNPTDSFCNWTMYKISEYIANKNIKLMFVHILRNDIPVLFEWRNRKAISSETNYK